MSGLGADPPEDGAAPAFRDVDRDDAPSLVAMMDATDAWPAVQAIRAWVLEQAAPRVGALVVDVGSGPGTFGAAARACGAHTLELDLSAVMIEALRGRHGGAAAVRADVGALPVVSGAADLVRAERVLQWSPDPRAALAELTRVAARGGSLALTDTDWSTLSIDHPDPAAASRLAAAAQKWIAHPTLARALPRHLRDAGWTDLVVRTDAVPILAWDPDDPRQLDGPPGLPLRTIAAAVPQQRGVLEADVDDLVDHARRGRFFAVLTLVTVLARRGSGGG